MREAMAAYSLTCTLPDWSQWLAALVRARSAACWVTNDQHVLSLTGSPHQSAPVNRRKTLVSELIAQEVFQKQQAEIRTVVGFRALQLETPGPAHANIWYP